jgi:hypothetical protein
LTCIFPKFFYGVFELPLLRNAQKRHKKIKKLKKKKVPTYPILSSARYMSLSILFFFGAPRLEWSLHMCGMWHVAGSRV